MRMNLFDRQFEDWRKDTGVEIANEQHLKELIHVHQNKPPHFVEIVASDGAKLLLGVGGEFVTAQYTCASGSPPYLVVKGSEDTDDEFIEFLMGDTLTPVSRHLCITFEKGMAVALHFYRTGKRLDTVAWEEI